MPAALVIDDEGDDGVEGQGEAYEGANYDRQLFQATARWEGVDFYYNFCLAYCTMASIDLTSCVVMKCKPFWLFLVRPREHLG